MDRRETLIALSSRNRAAATLGCQSATLSQSWVASAPGFHFLRMYIDQQRKSLTEVPEITAGFQRHCSSHFGLATCSSLKFQNL